MRLDELETWLAQYFCSSCPSIAAMRAIWRTGHIGNRTARLAVGDQNGDGRRELYALSINNCYGTRA